MPETQTVPLVDLHTQHATLRAELDRAIAEVIDHGQFVFGPALEQFERDFAEFCGTRHAVGVSSGLAALRLALQAVGIGPGDEVAVPAHTFAATVLAVRLVGATPLLVDVDQHTGTLDVDQLASRLTRQTRAVLPVHLYGQAADMAALGELAARHELAIIEDAAQAHGARCAGQPVGSFGQAGCFSFYPSKNLGALGDGGAVVTNDQEVARTVRMLGNYGQASKYHVEQIGGNDRLDTLQAAMLRVKLRHLRTWNEQRRQHAQQYRERLRGTPLTLPHEAPRCHHVYHLFVVRTAERDALARYLSQRGITTGIHYPLAIHQQPVFRHEPFAQHDFPVAEHWCQTALSLPMYPELTAAQIDYVCDAIRQFFATVR